MENDKAIGASEWRIIEIALRSGRSPADIGRDLRISEAKVRETIRRAAELLKSAVEPAPISGKPDLCDEGFQSGRRLFFVTGRSKSGTSWMGSLLNSHPQIFCDTSENSAFHQDFEFRYFGKDLDRMHENIARYFEERTWKLHKNGLIASLLCKNRKRSAERFGDKTPRQSVERILKYLPETQIVIMLRDFRDMLVSLAFHHQRTTGSWKGAFCSEACESLDEHFMLDHLGNYLKHGDLRKNLGWAERLPDQVVIVRFEDLKADPQAVLERVLCFLGVDASPEMASRCVAENTFEKLSGGRKPGQEDAGSFFRKGVVGDWKNHLSEENIELFKELAGDDLILAGYEKDNNWTLA